MELTPSQRRALRARAHSLHPVVAISRNGLTPTVLSEIERSLAAHELIKIRVFGAERDEREALLAQVCGAVQAAPVQHIGNILVIFREPPAEAKVEVQIAVRAVRKPARRSAPKATLRPGRTAPATQPRRRPAVRKG